MVGRRRPSAVRAFQSRRLAALRQELRLFPPSRLQSRSPFAPELCTGKALRNQRLLSVPKVLNLAKPTGALGSRLPLGKPISICPTTGSERQGVAHEEFQVRPRIAARHPRPRDCRRHWQVPRPHFGPTNRSRVTPVPPCTRIRAMLSISGSTVSVQVGGVAPLDPCNSRTGWSCHR